MMPVILVSLEWRRSQDGRYGLGISSIAAALKNAGIAWKIINTQVNSRNFSLKNVLDELMQAIEEAGTGCLVGFGTYIWNDLEVCNLIQQIKSTGVKIVMGGPQITYTAIGELEKTYPEADYFVRGHGEMAMVALASGKALYDDAIHIAGTPDLGIKAQLNLLELPSPYLLGTAEIWDNVRWETQRGCPFKCNFCQHREPGKWKKNAVFFDEHRLERELELFSVSRVKRISILDPIFHVNEARAIRILNMIKDSGIEAKISLQCRFEMCSSEFLDALDGLDVTLEFGLQTIIEDEFQAIDRQNNINKVCSVIQDLHKRQIDFEVSLIYGLPNQTLVSFQKSVEWCKEQKIPRVRAWPLMLLRGTPLYEHKAHYELVESTDQRIPIVVASKSFSKEEYAEMKRIAKEQEK